MSGWISTHRKAIAAVLTAVLGLVNESQSGETWLTVLAFILSAALTYLIPNEVTARQGQKVLQGRDEYST